MPIERKVTKHLTVQSCVTVVWHKFWTIGSNNPSPFVIFISLCSRSLILLSEANRNKIHQTPLSGPVLCDKELSEGWYRLVGATGTKMPTTRVPPKRCGTDWSGWLTTAHPTVEDGIVKREVCFSDRSAGCKRLNNILVKNCGSYFIYELQQPPTCNSRYCGTDWMWSKNFKK